MVIFTLGYSQNHWIELWVANVFADFFNIFLLAHVLLTSKWLFTAQQLKENASKEQSLVRAG